MLLRRQFSRVTTTLGFERTDPGMCCSKLSRHRATDLPSLVSAVGTNGRQIVKEELRAKCLRSTRKPNAIPSGSNLPSSAPTQKSMDVGLFPSQRHTDSGEYVYRRARAYYARVELPGTRSPALVGSSTRHFVPGSWVDNVWNGLQQVLLA